MATREHRHISRIQAVGPIVNQGKDNNAFWFSPDLNAWITAANRDYNKAWKERAGNRADRERREKNKK